MAIRISATHGGGYYPESQLVDINSGRHALEYILKYIHKGVKTIFIPYYTCDSIIQSIDRAGLTYKFYHIDISLEIAELPEVEQDSCILANNYYGIKDDYILYLAKKYGSRLIVDNTQAWYAPPLPWVNTFYSPRKFFGLPDGGVAFINKTIETTLEDSQSWHRCSHLLKRIDTGATSGYADFRHNSSTIGSEPMMRMSALTERLLSSIDFDKARDIRKTNFSIIADALTNNNQLKLPDNNSYACPMVYPYLTSDSDIRQELISNKIYVATYWPNVLDWCASDSTERYLTEHLIPIPVDQRYGEDDMKRILSIINK